MRMWNTPPEIMCQNHILGEHRELHILQGYVAHGMSIRGFVEKGILEIDNMVDRHDELVREFARRGWPSGTAHTTPMIIDREHPMIKEWYYRGSVHRIYTLLELLRRCPKCRDRYNRKYCSGLAEAFVRSWGLEPVNYKWEGLMVAWTNTTNDDPFFFSDVLVKEREEILRKKSKELLISKQS